MTWEINCSCISEPKAQGRNCSCFASKISEPKTQGRHCSCFASKTSEPKAQGRNCSCFASQTSEPAGYPINEDHPTSKKGARGFIKGCIFALCCCWICEECF